ncbi:hypothetical protein [Plantactinospora sonchi]|uniref:TIR domain-containing protein n=1 Tax=Plantactinospora sonchi TaxID=1544735 RepID=A0ABU7S3M0_9ACTN
MSWTDPAISTHSAEQRRRDQDPDTYFFLSYAHSVPYSSADDQAAHQPANDPAPHQPPPRPDTDHWVSRFFGRLEQEVTRRATKISKHRVSADPTPASLGFFDGRVSPGADGRRVLAEALSVAHVFVPLYSPNYFSNGWALGERESFLARLARLRPADARRHVLPVLWSPFPPGHDRPELTEALDLVTDPEYAENGLRVLSRLRAYRTQYDSILETLAARIVTVAENEPLPRSPATVLTSRPPTEEDGTPLVVTVLARAGTVRWRPYAGQHELPVAEYVAATAERLGLPTRIVDFTDARDQAMECPAIVLIDGELGEPEIRVAVSGLPRWVVPMVIGTDGARGTAAAERIAGSLQDAGLPQVRPLHKVDEFERKAPLLVIEARKQFLRHGPVNPPAGPSTPRPSLRPGDTSSVRRVQEEDL